jgi:hypothetical protein
MYIDNANKATNYTLLRRRMQITNLEKDLEVYNRSNLKFTTQYLKVEKMEQSS